MKQRMRWMMALALALGCGVSVPGAHAQVTGTDPDFPRGKISGYIFGDVYYNVTGDPEHRYDSSGADSANTNIDGSFQSNGQPKLIGKDLNGVQVRRVYFQHDADLSAKYSTRVRLEVDGKSLTSDGKLGVNVKAAYFQMKHAAIRGSFLIGVLSTPIWETSEDAWGLRSIEKTVGDFRGIGGSADIGVQMKGFADDGHKIGYNLMVGNGLGQKPENNRYKKVYFGLPLRPNSDLTIEPYVDYEWGAGGADKATYKLFVGYDMRKLSLGVEAYDRVNHSVTGPNKEPVALSFFGRYKASESATAFARYDRYQTNTRAANRIDADLYIAGVDFVAYKDVHIMPNIETTQYRAKGTLDAPPHHDMQARVTFYVKFAKP
jgi:hypothetical protein